uniref:CCHC-type domain-containing protein n=1 Tax=Tanacetum cinerariifolium TaxID=118510 RepID=A0A6L2NLB3_TANCI|nr:hypothetical protein [Tanacetum cinerariifolium]
MNSNRKQRQATKVHSPSSEILVKESVLTPFNDLLPSGEDSIQLNKLMILCTNLQQQVLDLEEAEITQANEIAKLKKRVKKLEKRIKSRPIGLRRLKKGRIHDAEMFRVDELEGNEVFVDVREKTVEKEVSIADPVTTAGEVVTVASVEDSVAPTTATIVDGGVKFLMFLRFLQVFLDKQVEGMAKNKEIYFMSSHTKKKFANMRRQGLGFSRNVTPLFETMMVIPQEEVGEGLVSLLRDGRPKHYYGRIHQARGRKARKHGKVFNWETTKYGKIWYDEDVLDLRSIKTKFPAIVFNDNLTSNETPSCEPTVSFLNGEIEFSISFDESDDEDHTVVFDKNLFSYKIISTNDLKADSENDNEKVNNPLFPSPKPTNLYVPYGIPLDPKRYYKDGDCARMFRRPRHVFFTLLNLGKMVSKNGYVVLDMAFPPRDQRQQYLKFEGLQYTEGDIADFETRLARIYRREDDWEVERYWNANLDMAFPPRDQRQQYLKFEGLQYTEGDIADFETRLARIYRREVHRVQNKDWIVGVDASYGMMWKALMKLMTERFQELTLLCTKMVLEEEDKVEKYTGGLPYNIQGNVIRVTMVRIGTDSDKNHIAFAIAVFKKFDNNSRDNPRQQQPFKRQNINGQNVCRMHHEGSYTVKCGNCKRVSHMNRDFKTAVAATAQRALVGNQTSVTCYECGRQGHYKSKCPKLRNQNHGNKIGIRLGIMKLRQELMQLEDEEIAPIPTLSRILETNVTLRGCTLGLLGHLFNIDLMPVELGSFDVIIGMDWLAKYHAVIVYDEKIVHIPYRDEVLIIEGYRCNGGNKSKSSIISCSKTQKYIQKGFQVYLSQVTTKKTDDKSEKK